MRRKLVRSVVSVLNISRITQSWLWKSAHRTVFSAATVPKDEIVYEQLTSASVVKPIRHHSTGVDVNVKEPLQTILLDSGKEVQIKWADGQQSDFHAVWLRYNCHCPYCRQDHSGQRTSKPFNPEHLSVSRAHASDGNRLVLMWNEEDHEGYIPIKHLQSHAYPESYTPVTQQRKREKMRKQEKRSVLQRANKDHSTVGAKILLGSLAVHLPKLEYEDLMKTDDGLLRWLRHINEHGMCLLKNVPTDVDMVIKVVELIAPVPATIYGKSFFVRSTEKPINIAYSTSALEYHQDLVYYESPPGLQFLHCMRFDSCVEGGESQLLDIISVAEQFKLEYPQHFDVLCRVPATFQKIHFDREDPVYMRYQRPHINVNNNNKVVNVIWAPPFEGPLSVQREDVTPYYKAYYKFAEAVQNSKQNVEFRMGPGDLMAFNNRTMVHARKGFVLNGGARIMQGCYLNIDDFKRKIAVLSHHHGDNRPLRHVGNQCWFEVENLKC